MKISIVYRVLSLISFIVSILMLLPLGFALYDRTADYMAFIGSMFIGFLTSLFFYILSLGESDYKEIGIKEAFAVVGFSWIIASAVGALPYILSGILPNYTDAFFEAMSGFSTTAASVISDIESCPRGIVFWRSLTLWLGGMGIIILGLAILPFFGVGGMELFKAEVPGPTHEKLTPRVHQTALLLWGVYVSLTVLEMILLVVGGMSIFDAVIHSFGTMATGGFSSKNNSISWFESVYIDWIITIFSFIAGASFVLHYKVITGGCRGYLKDDEFCFYAGVIILCTVVTTMVLRFGGWYESIYEALHFGAFQVVSKITTTGYNTAKYETWPYSIQFTLLMLMFFGGCACSTSGGLKNLRVLILFRAIRAEFIKILHPNSITHIHINNKLVSREAVSSVMVFIMVFISILVTGVLLMTFIGVGIMTSFLCVITTLCNTGTGMQLAGYENYAWLPDSAKWLLSFFMLAGRLELYAILMLFLPTTWKK